MSKMLIAGALLLSLTAASAALAQTPPAVGASAAASDATKAPAAAATVGTTTTTTTTTTTVATTPTPPKPKTKFSSASSLVDVMGDPAAKAVLAKYLPDAVPLLEMYLDQLPPDLTLDGLPDLSMGMVTPEQIKQINDDLVKI